MQRAKMRQTGMKCWRERPDTGTFSATVHMAPMCSLDVARMLQRGFIALLGWALLSCARPGATSRRPTEYYSPTSGIQTQSVPLNKPNEPASSPEPRSGEPLSSSSCEFAPGQLFPSSAPWNRNVSKARAASDSGAIIGFLETNHTSPHRFRTDFSFVLQKASGATPKRSFKPSEDHFTPDCDTVSIPIPAGGRLEGEEGYACTSGGDCHLLVQVPETCELYEMWRMNATPNALLGGCLAVWDMRMTFGVDGRGQGCSSADAAGLPITPLLFSSTDLVKGSVNHAIRLILPNQLIRRRVYVSPATHSTPATSGPESAPPYGARFRLKADVNVAGLSRGAQVVAQALKTYGMILVDGGVVSFTALTDRDEQVKWADTNFGARSLESLRWNDFEVVEPEGQLNTWQGECTRTPLTD